MAILAVSIGTGELDFPLTDFENYVHYAEAFNLIFSLLISLGILAVYTLGKRFYSNAKIGVLSSLSFLLIMGIGIASLGSIGTNVGFLFIVMLLIGLVQWKAGKPRWCDYFFLILLIMVILLIHIIAAVFMICLIVVIICWEMMRERNLRPRKILMDSSLVVLGLVIWLLFMALFAPDLLNGIIDEVIRKQTESTFIMAASSSSLDFFSENVNLMIRNPLLIMVIPLSIIGLAKDAREVKSYMIPFTMVSFAFALIPILPFIKTMSYIGFPIAVLAGLGIFHMMKKTNTLMVFSIICLLVMASMTISINHLKEESSSRMYYDYSTYEDAFYLSEWLNANFGESYTVVFPDSGAYGHVLNAFAKGKVLIAEPRYPDLPAYTECAKLYTIFPTSKEIYDFTNISGESKYVITRDYGITILIETNTYKVDIDKLLPYYEDLQVVSFSDRIGIILLG